MFLEALMAAFFCEYLVCRLGALLDFLYAEVRFGARLGALLLKFFFLNFIMNK